MGSFIHMDQNSFEDTFSQLKKFQLDGAFCDVTLKIDEGREMIFHGHKVILAARSHYFYTMFTSNLAESREDTITLKGVSAAAFNELMSYAYTGKVRIRPENVEELLDAAHMLQFESVEDACFEFLRNNLDCGNCISIAYLAQKYHCKKAQREAEDFCRQNFRVVTKAREYLDLDFDQVVHLVASDELNITNESEVYKAIITWVKHNEESRSKYLNQLLNYLRVPLLTRKFIIDILAKEELIIADVECRRFLLKAMDYHLIPERRDQSNFTKITPRETVTKKMLVIGGENRSGVLKTIECYDVSKYSWETRSSLSQGRKFASALFLDGIVYLVGGIGIDGSDLKLVERYDPTNDKWSHAASMNECQGAIAVAVLEGWLYAIGGSHGCSALKIVERYDPVLDRWTHVQSMRFPRSHFGVAAYAGKLHAIGGYCGISEIEHCEAYDPLTNRWKDMADLNKARMNHGVIVHSERIFAIGGQSPSSILDSIEKYNAGLNMWLIVKHTLDPRSGAGVALITSGNDESTMYIVGGLDTNHICHNSVKILDLNTIDYNITNSIGMLEPRAYGTVITF